MGAVKNAKINIFIQKSGCIINCAALSNSVFFRRGVRPKLSFHQRREDFITALLSGKMQNIFGHLEFIGLLFSDDCGRKKSGLGCGHAPSQQGNTL